MARASDVRAARVQQRRFDPAAVHQREAYRLPLDSILKRATGYVSDKQQIEARLNQIEGQVREQRPHGNLRHRKSFPGQHVPRSIWDRMAAPPQDRDYSGAGRGEMDVETLPTR